MAHHGGDVALICAPSRRAIGIALIAAIALFELDGPAPTLTALACDELLRDQPP